MQLNEILYAYPVDHYRRYESQGWFEGFRFVAVRREQIIRQRTRDAVVDQLSRFLAQTDFLSALKFSCRDYNYVKTFDYL